MRIRVPPGDRRALGNRPDHSVVADVMASFPDGSVAVAFAMRNDVGVLRAGAEMESRFDSKRGARRPMVMAVNLLVCRCWREA
jgi:hypothetical protein